MEKLVTAQQLITLLEDAIKEHGDLPVYLWNYDPGPVEAVGYEKHVNEKKKAGPQNEPIIAESIVIY